MSSLEKNLYKQITVKSNKRTQDQGIGSRAYRGISTVNPENSSTVLYDLALIKQDLLNHFHIRQGEKLSNPEFGTIIWDALFEPLTDDMRNAIKDNVTEIVNYDQIVSVISLKVDKYEKYKQIIRCCYDVCGRCFTSSRQ